MRKFIDHLVWFGISMQEIGLRPCVLRLLRMVLGFICINPLSTIMRFLSEAMVKV